MPKHRLRVIPLGGLGEVGRNMTLFEYGDNIVVVDCGLMFPESEMLGVDIVLPSFDYLLAHRDRLRGIVITHGHEDHQGALPYLLPHVDAPIFATRLTRGLIEVKLREHRLLEKARFITVTPGDTFNLGPFRTEFFHVAHSIPDVVGVAMDTPVGLVVHTAEYKFDYTPASGHPTDFQKLAEFGRRGTLVLLGDSTNAERPGYTPSERLVYETFERLFPHAPGRIIVSTFASNISRVQQVIDVAHQQGRRVGVVGRSMVDTVRMAQELGYLTVPDGSLLRPEELESMPPSKVAIVCTGSQGEPTSALVRMANQEHRQVNIRDGDTVILSATPIPGNEELVHRTINNLYRLGARVFYPPLEPVHVSGHASREELKLMLTLVRPQFFMPIQGEYRQLVHHADLAEVVGIRRDNIFVVESGQVVEFDEASGNLGERVDGGYVYVDGLGIGEIGEVVLRDRAHLAEDGFFVAIVAVAKQSGELAREPDILTRGFIYAPDAEAIVAGAKQVIVQALAQRAGHHTMALQDTLHTALSEYLYAQTHRRPMVLPLVMEV